MLSEGNEEYRLLKVTCCDRKCQAVLSVSSFETIVECHQCGQKHEKSTLQDVQVVSEQEMPWALETFVQRMLRADPLPKRGPEMVKVLGLSNYYCKLLSPLLTRYGMDKVTGRAKLLKDMNQSEIFDCSLFGDRAFLIEPQHISIPGFGRDITGSVNYLSETLNLITIANGGEERLIPIHADGDGHCLVHAVSRALVGRELFWHPLRCCLKRHFQNNLDKYKA
ncbi:Deubiquitinating protein, partial [Stegodyphus mimosarum]